MMEALDMTPAPTTGKQRWDVNVGVGLFQAVVQCPDLDLLTHLLGVFPQSSVGLAHLVAPSATYEVESMRLPGTGKYRVVRNGQEVLAASSWGQLAGWIEADLTLSAARFLGFRYHLVHAGAVAWKGKGVLIPAESGAGKSTLVAVLTLLGFAYLSDEFGVLTKSGRLLPFAKAICLRQPGWDALSAYFPGVPRALHSNTNDEGKVHMLPPGTRACASRPPDCSVELVILPTYKRGARAHMEMASRSSALSAMVGQSMNLRLCGSDGFEALARVVKRATCYAVTYGDVSSSVALADMILERLRDPES